MLRARSSSIAETDLYGPIRDYLVAQATPCEERWSTVTSPP